MLLEAPQEDKSSNYKKDGSSLELPFKRKNSYVRSRGLTACNIAIIITITISVIHCSSVFLLLTQQLQEPVNGWQNQTNGDRRNAIQEYKTYTYIYFTAKQMQEKKVYTITEYKNIL